MKEKNKFEKCVGWLLDNPGVIIVVLIGIVFVIISLIKWKLQVKLDILVEKRYAETKSKIKNIKKVKRYQKAYDITPTVLRISFVIVLVIYDVTMIHFFAVDNNKLNITGILKDVTIWNATLLSIFVCISFILRGRIIKLEDLVAKTTKKVDEFCLKFYGEKTEIVMNNLSTSDNKIVEIDKDLTLTEKKLKIFD